jgi:hypothetical protein
MGAQGVLGEHDDSVFLKKISVLPMRTMRLFSVVVGRDRPCMGLVRRGGVEGASRTARRY